MWWIYKWDVWVFLHREGPVYNFADAKKSDTEKFARFYKGKQDFFPYDMCASPCFPYLKFNPYFSSSFWVIYF